MEINHNGAFEGYLADEILLLIVKSKETISMNLCPLSPRFLLQKCIVKVDQTNA